MLFCAAAVLSTLEASAAALTTDPVLPAGYTLIEVFSEAEGFFGHDVENTGFLASASDGTYVLVFRGTARNFNPLCAMAARITIAEVEELVEPGAIDPRDVELPGIYVQRVVVGGGVHEKRIEKRTTRLEA